MRFKRVQREGTTKKSDDDDATSSSGALVASLPTNAHTQQHAFFLLHAPKRTPEDAPMKALVALITCVWCFVSNEKAFSRTNASNTRSASILNRTRESTTTPMNNNTTTTVDDAFVVRALETDETREALATATKHITTLTNETNQSDLLELLREAPREAYSLQQPGWPSELRNLTSAPLPKIVLERYETRESVCFCGCFPEISRAWATVDDSLFLWRFDVDDDVPIELTEEFNGQPIVCVGLADPREGVFVSQIAKILVVCTTVEIKMLGIVSDASHVTASKEDTNTNGKSDRRDAQNGSRGKKKKIAFDVNAPLLIRDTTFSCPTDAIVFNQICGCSRTGRIFLAGNDSHAYELKYHGGGGGDMTLASNGGGSSSSFFSRGQPRVRKVKFSSSGFSYYIPNSLNVFSVEDPLLQILCDEERNILYTRSQNGAVRVYDLGAKGMDAPRRVVEVNDIAQLAGRGISSGGSYYGNGSRRSMYNGGGNSMFENRSPSYGGSRGGYGSPRYGDYRSPSSSGRYGQGSQTTEAKKKAGKLVHIAIVSTQESASVTLVGVCADGRRVYLTALPSPSSYGSYYPSSYHRISNGSSNSSGSRYITPTRLSVVETRDPPPSGGSSARGLTSARALLDASANALEVEAAHYYNGVLLLSDSSSHDESSKLFLATRDAMLPMHLQLPPPMTAPRNTGPARGLREVVQKPSILEGRVAANVGAIGELPMPSRIRRDLDPPFPKGTPASVVEQFTGSKLRSELVEQSLFRSKRRKFALVTNSGVVTFEKARPIDTLATLLQSKVPEHIEEFFSCYGPVEAAIMCLTLSIASAVHLGFAEPIPPSVRDAARRAFEDPRFTGEPRVDSEDADVNGTKGANGQNDDAVVKNLERSSAAFNMGRAIVQPSLHFSSAHKAIHLYVARAVQAIWERPLAIAIRESQTAEAANASSSNRYGYDTSRSPLRFASDALRSAARFIGDDLILQLSVEPETLETIEQRLRPIEKYLQTRKPRTSSQLTPAKRRKLALNAAREEENSMDALLALVSRASQAICLLKLCSETDDFESVAAALPHETRVTLTQMSIRRFISTPEGAKVASALIESLMARVVSSSRGDAAPSADALGGAVQKRSEQLSKMLQYGAPDFFGADSRTFYRARDILQRAREARALRDVEKRDGFVGEALRLFAQAPLAGDLNGACAELVDLRAFHGVVTLSLAAAATLRRMEEQRKADASTGGRVQAEPDMSLAQCYALISTAIKSLVTGKPSDTFVPDDQRANTMGTQQQQQQQHEQDLHPGSLAVVCASLPKDAREAGIRRILDKIVESEEDDVIQVAAETLIALDRLDDVCRLPPHALEAFLCEYGALNKHLSLQPTTREEAKHLQLLTRLYGDYGQEGMAADVCVALAERHVADRLYPSLEERMGLFRMALMYGTTKDPATGAFKRDARQIEEIEGKAKVLEFQMRLENALRMKSKRMQSMAAGEVGQGQQIDHNLVQELEQAANDLRENMKSISDLYNDIARPHRFWDICLEIIAWARPQRGSSEDQESYADASAVPRELWDCVIIDAVQDVLSRANETHTRRAIVAAACAAVAEIAPKVFTESAANNEIAFPMCHVTCRLETLASGQWGVMLNSPSVNESEQAEDDDIADCMLQSVRGNCPPVQRAYDRLLAAEHRRMHDEEIGEEMHKALHSTKLRLRMLRSALRVMHAWDAATGGSGNGFSSGVGDDRNNFDYSSRKSFARASIGDICLAYSRVSKELVGASHEQNVPKELAVAFERLADRFLR